MLPNRDKLPCRSSKGESGVIVLSAGDSSAQLCGGSKAGERLSEGIADAVLRVLGRVEADSDGGVWELDRSGAGGW
jgi:hypothetical protein